MNVYFMVNELVGLHTINQKMLMFNATTNYLSPIVCLKEMKIINFDEMITLIILAMIVPTYKIVTTTITVQVAAGTSITHHKSFLFDLVLCCYTCTYIIYLHTV